MSLNSQKILGVRVTTDTREKVLEYIQKYLSQHILPARQPSKKRVKPFVIVTPNPEQIVLAQRNKRFLEILNRADVALPDGIGVQLASRLLSGARDLSGVRSRIHGVDFMKDLVGIAADRGVRIGLIGGFDDLAVKTLECLQQEYPRLQGWAAEGPELLVDSEGNMEGPTEDYWKQLRETMDRNKVGILFVGLGAPKQEFFIDKLSPRVPVVCMSVGGSFDLLVGTLKRAPLFIRSIGFEWFWRLVQEPWRWKRQRALMRFIYLILRAKMQKR